MTGEPIRTLHILTSLQRRGAEISAVALTDRLTRDQFLPAIWTIAPTAPDRGVVTPMRTPVLAPPSGSARETPRRALGRLRRAVRQCRPQIVHAHGGRALKYALAARWLGSGVRACVYTKIGSVHPSLDHPLKRHVYAILFEGTDAIVAVGAAMQQEVETLFHPRRPRLVTIPTGIDSRPYAAVGAERRAAIRGELGMSPDEVCLMMVGSLSWEKDPGAGLGMLADLASDHPNLRLVFVGEGPLGETLRRKVAGAGLEGRVRFLGVREDIPAVLSASDIVLLPSRTEGLPAVLIEAGLAARPAVAFDVGCVRDIVMHGISGFVVPPGNREAFRARLRELAGNAALRRSMGAVALAHCESTYGIERYVREHETLFVDLLAERVSADRTLASLEADGSGGGWRPG